MPQLLTKDPVPPIEAGQVGADVQDVTAIVVGKVEPVSYSRSLHESG